MRRFIVLPRDFVVQSLLLATLCLAFVRGASAEEPNHVTKLRVMTYNIHHGEGTDGVVDLERIAKVIRDARPDLVAVQEVDNQTQRTGGVDQRAELARMTGMQGLFGHQIPYEGGEYGQAILSRLPVSDLTIHWLPGEPERQRRIAVSCRVDLGGGQEIEFVTTHLHHFDQTFREQQAEVLNRIFSETPRPVILGGDLNARPDNSVLKILTSQWQNATAGQSDRLTGTAPNPTHQIDYLLARPADRWTVVETYVPQEPIASDHFPLVVEYEIKTGPKKDQ